MILKRPVIYHISTFPPSLCGLATYANDLSSELQKFECNIVRVQIVHPEQPIESSTSNRLIFYNDGVAFNRLAREVNVFKNAIVLIEHEFKIFGGPGGNIIVDFLKNVFVPVIATLHTVKTNLDEERNSVISFLCSRINIIFVFCDSAAKILRNFYNVDPSKILIINHGVRLNNIDIIPTKELQIRFYNDFIMMTPGFIRPSKGYDTVLEALTHLPSDLKIKYFVIGQTHPRDSLANSYFDLLKSKVKEYNIESKVVFITEYLSDDKYMSFLNEAHIGILPYKTMEQASSGVLAQFRSLKVPVISTSFLQASEMALNDVGVRIFDGTAKELSILIEEFVYRNWNCLRISPADELNKFSWTAIAKKYLMAAIQLLG